MSSGYTSGRDYRVPSRNTTNWSMLPGNVLLSVCDLLPTRQTGVFRLVCKAWKQQINGGIHSLMTNAVCPYPVPLTKISCLFPNLVDLDLSCHKWGYGQTLSTSYCTQLGSLQALRNLKSLRLVNWVTLSLEGMECIGQLKKVEILDFTNCLSMTDKYLQYLCQTRTNIKRLFLNYCERITDQGISHVASISDLVELRVAHIPGIMGRSLYELSSKLEYLDLSFCDNLSDEGVRDMINHGGYVHNLVYLDLSGCQKILSTTLTSLSSLSNLARLNLAVLPNLVEMEQWSPMTKLKVLDVSFSSRLMMQQALPLIGRMTQLRTLRLDGCPLVHGVQPEILKDLKNLKCLDLGRWSNLQFGLEVTDSLSNLEVLNLADGGGCVRSQNHQYFKHATKLKVLGLSGYAYLPMNVIHGLSTVHSLEVLNLSGLGNLNDSMVKEISKLTSLTYLDLSQNSGRCKVTKFGIKYLGCLKMLENLKLSGWSEMSPNAFLVLRYLKHLTSLDLSNCFRLTDKGIKAISIGSSQSLIHLNLMNCYQVTCYGLGFLKKCENLDKLILSYHTKEDIETELPRIKNIEFVSPADFVIDNGYAHNANFQHMLETMSREEKEDTLSLFRTF